MSQSITIKSSSYSGQNAEILFVPEGESTTINLGIRTLPYLFEPGLLSPPKEIYGTYTILVENITCSSILIVPKPTPTPTPTTSPTPTPTPTPTSTPTPTPSPTNDPCVTPTPVPVYNAYLFIEPVSGSSSIGQWMFDGGLDFYGFTNTSQPSQNQTDFNFEMNRYVDFLGWTNGQFPSIISQTVPQTNGGVDSFGNPKVQYNFLTTKVAANTVGCDAWYTWIIPPYLTNGQNQTVIDLNTANDPNLFTQVTTESTIYSYTFTYSGSTIPKVTYKVYTTFPNNIFQINNSQNIYFRGNSVSP